MVRITLYAVCLFFVCSVMLFLMSVLSPSCLHGGSRRYPSLFLPDFLQMGIVGYGKYLLSLKSVTEANLEIKENFNKD